jgi:hypothetical protein
MRCLFRKLIGRHLCRKCFCSLGHVGMPNAVLLLSLSQVFFDSISSAVYAISWCSRRNLPFLDEESGREFGKSRDQIRPVVYRVWQPRQTWNL